MTTILSRLAVASALLLSAVPAQAALPGGEISVLCVWPQDDRFDQLSFHLPKGFGSGIGAVEIVDPKNLLRGSTLSEAQLMYNDDGNAVFSLSADRRQSPRMLLVMTQFNLESQFDAVLGTVAVEGAERFGRCFGLLDPKARTFGGWKRDPASMGNPR
jgi:hypothetical protein